MVEDPVIVFSDAAAWADWMAKHHRTSQGVWLRLAKKGADLTTVSYSEALDIALCYGWIDAQRRGESANTWLIRFTVRGPRSIWSKLNCERVRKLEASRRMKAAGRAAVEQAKKDGRWDAAYEGQHTMEVPADFTNALARDRKARAAFESLDSANRYAILFRLHHAKRVDTRAKKVEDFVAMLARGETIHPKRAPAKRRTPRQP